MVQGELGSRRLGTKTCAGGREAHKEVKVLPRAVLAGTMPAVRADAGAPKRRRKGAAGGADAALCGPCFRFRRYGQTQNTYLN